MTFFCLLENRSSTATHMEPLESACRKSAVNEAVRLLAEHPSASLAHVLRGDKIVATVSDARRGH